MDREELVRNFLQFRRHVFDSAYAVIRDVDVAEDVAQEVWVRIIETGAAPRTRKALATWLRVVTRRAALDHIRKEGRARERARRLMTEVSDRLEHDEDGDAHDALQAALAELPDRQRAVVELRFIHGHSVHETARALGIAEGTVKATLSHARQHCVGF